MTATGARALFGTELTEKQWQQTVVEYAELRGWLVYHTHDSRRSAPGFPDLVMLRGRRQVVVELKAERGRVSGSQQRWLQAFADTAAETYVWRPSDLHVALRALE